MSLILLVGERNLAHRAHQGIEASLAAVRAAGASNLPFAWVGTADLTPESRAEMLGAATGIWCVPASPYASAAGALLAIRFARENRIPFLGTCGGFQHALLEFTQNVLHRRAEHAEESPAAENPVVQPLSCSLAGKTGRIIAVPGSGFERLLGASETREEFNCNYGFNPAWENAFQNTALEFVARDELGQVRAIQIKSHPFFVGTLFQPERKILSAGAVHPLISAFLDRAS